MPLHDPKGTSHASLRKSWPATYLAPQAYEPLAVQLSPLDLQKYLRPGTDLVTGAVEIASNRLARSAEMAREERLGDGDVRQPVRRLLEAVPFVRVDDIGDGYTF